MDFIELHKSSDGSPVLIRTSKIIGVYKYEGKIIVDCGYYEGCYFTVKEDYETVWRMLVNGGD